ncbi:hypothetical protein PoB_006317600 [Plakobranchus ocellatus]|uniref:NADH dehydrogenase subunit 6 n=1 Tax=Plakobranchus ocellatus TaxID=259542 RepID=A0AAV4CXP9_9GAST|nr:hypothetical protein PoB_006317600 [Plakobranchus ocellatus]
MVELGKRILFCLFILVYLLLCHPACLINYCPLDKFWESEVVVVVGVIVVVVLKVVDMMVMVVAMVVVMVVAMSMVMGMVVVMVEVIVSVRVLVIMVIVMVMVMMAVHGGRSWWPFMVGARRDSGHDSFSE